VAVWDDLLDDADRASFAKARMGGAAGMGERPALLVVDMTYAFVDGWWSDAGTFDSLLRANILVASQFEGNSDEIPQAAIQTSASILRQQ